MTVILPPSEIRLIIEKLAAYVVKNGPTFEDKILEKERHNPRFSFLYPNDPYHAYYQKRLEEYHKVGPEGVDELLAQSRDMEQKQSFPLSSSQIPKFVEKTKIPSESAPLKEPEPLDFVVNLPFVVSALDYDVIKLTAQYVARNGRQFLISLSQREAHNVQFDFLKPGHSLHAAFLRLVEQYARLFLPSKTMLEKLHFYAERRFELFDRIIQRTQYMRYTRDKQAKEDEFAEEERLAFASIDWNDFVVVETINLTAADQKC